MKKSIILGFNYHLPQSSSDAMFERIYHTRLKPFFQTLYMYPKIPFALHLSGPLFYKIERMYSEFFMLLSDMVKRKQVELVGGAFYEPMLPLFLYPDSAGQIELMTTYLRKHFGKRVRGCWVPGPAWEQSVAYTIARTGLTYSFSDERNFINAGLTEEYYNFPCICEDRGLYITVFPLFSSLTRTIRERGITAVLDGLLSKRRSHGFVRAVFPDFFSETSDIDELVIPRFFDEISRYEADINFSLPSDELYQDTPLQKVYFPNTVGKKFLVDFPEAGLLYAKISHTKRFISLLKGDKERKKGAQEDLWKVGDFSLFCCSDLCQHGNDGQYPGSANAPLRNAAYKAMLEVERRTTREWHGWVPSLVSRDFDFDGALEYLFQGALVNCFVRQRGAAVFELDYLPAAWNYQNTIALATQIPRETESSFYDIIAPQNCTGNGEDAAPATVRRLGTEIWRQDDIDRKHLRIDFRLPARENGPWAALESHKEYKLCDNTLTVRYKLINTDAKQLNFSFITRLNLSFADDKDKMLRIFAYDTWQSFNNTSEKRPIALTSTGIQQVEAIDFQDINNELIVNVSSDSAFDSVIKQFSAPYKNALGEIIDQYQWTSIWPRKQITLNAGATTEFVFKVEFFK